MIEEEFAAVEESPEDIGQSLLPGRLPVLPFVVLDEAESPLQLLRPGLTRQGCQVKRLDLPGGVQEWRREDGGQQLAALQGGLLRDQLTIHQGQRLED